VPSELQGQQSRLAGERRIHNKQRHQDGGQPGSHLSREGPWQKWWDAVLEHRNDTGEERGSSKKLWAEH